MAAADKAGIELRQLSFDGVDGPCGIDVPDWG
jgi:hypothetical protein